VKPHVVLSETTRGFWRSIRLAYFRPYFIENPSLKGVQQEGYWSLEKKLRL
jgi:hypothetical protein